jgi:hypothetical protein
VCSSDLFEYYITNGRSMYDGNLTVDDPFADSPFANSLAGAAS